MFFSCARHQRLKTLPHKVGRSGWWEHLATYLKRFEQKEVNKGKKEKKGETVVKLLEASQGELCSLREKHEEVGQRYSESGLGKHS